MPPASGCAARRRSRWSGCGVCLLSFAYETEEKEYDAPEQPGRRRVSSVLDGEAEKEEAAGCSGAPAQAKKEAECRDAPEKEAECPDRHSPEEDEVEETECPDSPEEEEASSSEA